MIRALYLLLGVVVGVLVVTAQVQEPTDEDSYYLGVYDSCVLLTHQAFLHRNSRYTGADHVEVIRFCDERLGEIEQYDMFSQRGEVENNINPSWSNRNG